jgi:hypothetical protein
MLQIRRAQLATLVGAVRRMMNKGARDHALGTCGSASQINGEFDPQTSS